MGLQRFKQHVASSVVNASNASLSSMDTQQLLDLFETSTAQASAPGRRAGGPRGTPGAAGAAGRVAGVGVGASAVLHEVGELWAAEQYEEEHDLERFLDNLE